MAIAEASGGGKPSRGITLTMLSLAVAGLILSGLPTTAVGQTLTSAPATTKGRIVEAGDKAEVHFTCRLKNGEVAISTYQDVAVDMSMPKSPIFLPRDRNDPISFVAGTVPEKLAGEAEKGFEGEIVAQLSKAIVGFRTGEKTSVGLRADRLPERQAGQYVIKMPRVRTRPKEMRFTPEQYLARTGNKAEVGRSFSADPILPGKIESVTEKEVLIRFPAEPGKEVPTPFGRGIIRDARDQWEIVINPGLGKLVRSGGLVGKVAQVDDKEITLDYGNPFGYESLDCDVLVVSASPDDKNKKIETAHKGQNQGEVKHEQ